MAPARFCTCLGVFKCHENCQQHKAIALKLFLNRSEVRIRTKITHILCLQMREQSVHISKLMFECSYFSSVSSKKAQYHKKSNNRGSMLWFNRKQIKTTNCKTEKENTLSMKSSVLG